MANYLLQKGDKIRLEKGMRVYAPIPSKFLFANTPFSTGVYESEAIEIGRVYRKQVVTKEELLNKSMDAIAGVLHISAEELNKMSRKEMETFIDSLNLNFDEEEFDSSIYAGEYMVEYVSFGGGGVQGTPSGYETYAHGWRVFCVKLDNPSIRVNFYQTSSFTATIPDICPINQ